MGKWLKAFWYEEDGVGIVEIILILVVLVMLVVIFRNKIKDIVEAAFGSITKNSNEINKKITISSLEPMQHSL